MHVVMNVPSYLQGSLPPPVDVPQLPRGSTPLGSSALGSTATVDPSLVKQLVDAGWSVSSWTFP
jgi:hypothetical protein